MEQPEPPFGWHDRQRMTGRRPARLIGRFVGDIHRHLDELDI